MYKKSKATRLIDDLINGDLSRRWPAPTDWSGFNVSA